MNTNKTIPLALTALTFMVGLSAIQSGRAVSWATTGSMTGARLWHTATLLPNGQVLVAGGWDGTNLLSSAELYDPATGMWRATGAMNIARYRHTATLLLDGRVLVAAGIGTNYLSDAELYNTNSGTWTITGSLTFEPANPTATLLSNGLVLVAGWSVQGGTSELYDPTNGTWTTTGDPSNTIEGENGDTKATLLAGGQVLWQAVLGAVPVSGGPVRSCTTLTPGLGFRQRT